MINPINSILKMKNLRKLKVLFFDIILSRDIIALTKDC